MLQVRYKFLLLCFVVASSFLLTEHVFAADETAGVDAVGSVTGLAVPRMVSLRSDKVYVRSGPGMRYPIKWIYRKRDLPVRIEREFGTWRRIADADGESGWVHQSLLSGRRFVISRVDESDPEAPIILFRKPNTDSTRKARIEAGVILRLEDEACKDGWCQVATSGFKGWVGDNHLWGVDPVRESDKSE